jgi:hypothetical protein
VAFGASDERTPADDEGRPVGDRPPASPVMAAGGRLEPSRRWVLALTVLALLSRLVWVLVVHPPGDYVFSDMAKYVDRAQDLADNGFRWGIRPLAWQAWGTHYILAVPLWLFGKDNLVAGAVVWALMGAGAVPLGYLLASRVCRHASLPKVVGVAMLAWHPSLSNTGYFLSETPFLFFQLWSTYWLVVLMQDGRRALGAGMVSAVAFAVRPQSALFFLLVLVTWLVNRKRLPHVRLSHLLAVALPLLLVLGYAFGRFHAHTGYGPGVAENANMNLTAGRCHNIVTQAFASEAQRRRSEARRNTRDGRRVSLPGYRVLAKRFPPEHPLALRPALESETIRFVGYIGDPEIHREIRRECYARTGLREQLRYSVVNASLLWFFGHQWPEIERGRERFYAPLSVYKSVFQILIWLPSMLGMILAIRGIRRRPELTLLAWQIVTSTVVAAIFFGTIRLRTPYDPYAIILALEVWAALAIWARTRVRRLRTVGAAGTGPSSGSAA